jgi:hypothetical protein
MLRRRHYVAVGVLAILALVRPAGAVFHLAVIDEVATSYGGDNTAQFIEIRMLTGFQNAVANSVLAAFDSSGTYINDILVVPGNVPNQGTDVRWLVATTSFQTAAGITADFTMPSGILPTGGGMLCFGGGGGVVPAAPNSWSRTNFPSYVDCVAYGTYSGATNVHTGTPTTLDGDGHSLQRTTNTMNNLADFVCGDPLTPENNAGVTKTLAATSPCPMINPTPTPTPLPGVCPASPDGACLSGFATGLLLVNEATGSQKLLVKMVGGPAFTQTDLGNPLSSGGTAYAVCIYDNLGGLVSHLSVDQAGNSCRGNPCWKVLGGAPPSGKGYKYKDGTLSSDGVSLILIKGGAAGQSKALVKAGGSNLPGGITAALQSSTNATVQLRGSDATQCLSVTLTDIKKQDSNTFKAKK